MPYTVSGVKEFFRSRKLFPKKRLGQSFLVDKNILISIVDAAAVCDRDIVLEIGTGTGSLTELLGERAGRVLSVEIDRDLFNLSRYALSPRENIHPVNMDVLSSKTSIDPRVAGILKEWLLADKGAALKVVSNLPYSISTPAIIALLESELPVELMVLTLQKEIVDRLTAGPRTKDYGVLSIIARLFCVTHVIRALPPSVFWPQPQVESAIVRLEVDKEKARRVMPDYELFSAIVRTTFQSRRKTLLNGLLRLKEFSAGAGAGADADANKKALQDVLKRLGIDPRIRGEALDLEGFLRLTREIHTLRGE
ncbi:MAG: ribosomal RNA small subunit methyltransferase A [Planctomycetes bacterium]|nr:ribosomal RNA small subunit methyltransferase A [Planctomycetota bacterium]